VRAGQSCDLPTQVDAAHGPAAVPCRTIPRSGALRSLDRLLSESPIVKFPAM